MMAEVVSIWMARSWGQTMGQKNKFEGKIPKPRKLPDSLSRTQKDWQMQPRDTKLRYYVHAV